jgi:hypothetical protein
MHRLNIPVFERLLISTWAIFQLTTGAIGWMILSNASNPTVSQVARSHADSHAAQSSRNQAAVRSEPSSLKQAIAQSVTLPEREP